MSIFSVCSYLMYYCTVQQIYLHLKERAPEQYVCVRMRVMSPPKDVNFDP